MMKQPFLLFIVFTCTLSVITSCDSKNRYRPEQDNFAEVYRSTDEYKRREAELRAKVREGRRAAGDLVIVDSKTRYGTDFVPTVHLTLQNKSDKVIAAFSLRSKVDYIDFRKQVKVRLKPNQTYSTSIRIPDSEGLGEDITLLVDQIVYSDGKLVDVF